MDGERQGQKTTEAEDKKQKKPLGVYRGSNQRGKYRTRDL